MASASVSIDTAAGPAINPGRICAESHQVAPGLKRDEGTLMSPGLLISSITGRWLRFRGGAINGRQPAFQTCTGTVAVYQCVSLVADSRNLNLPGDCFPPPCSWLQLVDLQDMLPQLGIWTRLRRGNG